MKIQCFRLLLNGQTDTRTEPKKYIIDIFFFNNFQLTQLTVITAKYMKKLIGTHVLALLMILQNRIAQVTIACLNILREENTTMWSINVHRCHHKVRILGSKVNFQNLILSNIQYVVDVFRSDRTSSSGSVCLSVCMSVCL